MHKGAHWCPQNKTILTVKEPLSLLYSLYKFNRYLRMPTHGSFAMFIRNEFILSDTSRNPSGPQYIFSTPIEYINQYYYA